MSRRRHPRRSGTRARRAQPQRGSERLRASLHRLARLLRRPPQPASPRALPASSQSHNLQPASDWERAAEARLLHIERQLASQNRLLLFTLVSIVADLVYRVTLPAGVP